MKNRTKIQAVFKGKKVWGNIVDWGRGGLIIQLSDGSVVGVRSEEIKSTKILFRGAF